MKMMYSQVRTNVYIVQMYRMGNTSLHIHVLMICSRYSGNVICRPDRQVSLILTIPPI